MVTARQALERAYLETNYRVLCATDSIDIRIGVSNVALDTLLQARGVHNWAFVSASNPRSQMKPDEDNARRHGEMTRSLHAERRLFVDALGMPDHADWMPERSVLILGIARPEALALARRWQQNAIVYGRLGELPELVWAD
jgi:Protein of unknown function (DUF3293)